MRAGGDAAPVGVSLKESELAVALPAASHSMEGGRGGMIQLYSNYVDRCGIMRPSTARCNEGSNVVA